MSLNNNRGPTVIIFGKVVSGTKLTSLLYFLKLIIVIFFLMSINNDILLLSYISVSHHYKRKGNNMPHSRGVFAVSCNKITLGALKIISTLQHGKKSNVIMYHVLIKTTINLLPQKVRFHLTSWFDWIQTPCLKNIWKLCKWWIDNKSVPGFVNASWYKSGKKLTTKQWKSLLLNSSIVHIYYPNVHMLNFVPIFDQDGMN